MRSPATALDTQSSTLGCPTKMEKMQPWPSWHDSPTRNLGAGLRFLIEIRTRPNGPVAKFENGGGMGRAGPHFTTAIEAQLEQLERLTTDLVIVFVELFGTRV